MMAISQYRAMVYSGVSAIAIRLLVKEKLEKC